MSLALPVISGRECGSLLESFGFVFVRQKGSHRMYRKEAEESEEGVASAAKSIVIPDHDELDRGTLAAILRQAGIERQKFVERYHG